MAGPCEEKSAGWLREANSWGRASIKTIYVIFIFPMNNGTRHLKNGRFRSWGLPGRKI